MNIKEKYIDGNGSKVARGAAIGTIAYVIGVSFLLAYKIVMWPVRAMLGLFTRRR